MFDSLHIAIRGSAVHVHVNLERCDVFNMTVLIGIEY
jgi:hypothetical protein